jgi:hypothetical protein
MVVVSIMLLTIRQNIDIYLLTLKYYLFQNEEWDEAYEYANKLVKWNKEKQE